MSADYSASFRAAVAIVLEHEGSAYTNDPNDPGGETRYGISKAQYPDRDIAALSIDDAIAIYWADYWSPLQLDSLISNVASKVMDMAVHLGPHTAVKIVQQALCFLRRNVKVDGILGPATRAAIQGTRKSALFAAICGFQFMEYRRQIESQPTKQRYSGNWSERAMWRPA